MQAFLVGLIFLIAVAILSGIGFLLLPVLMVMAFLLRWIIGFLLIIFGIWLLGKFIIYVWEKMRDKGKPDSQQLN